MPTYTARGGHVQGRGIQTNHTDARPPLYEGEDILAAVKAAKAWLGQLGGCPRNAQVLGEPLPGRIEFYGLSLSHSPIVWWGTNQEGHPPSAGPGASEEENALLVSC